MTLVHVTDSGTLSFRGKDWKIDDAQTAKPVTDSIKAASSLKVLCLSSLSIGLKAANEIGKALEGHAGVVRAQWADIFVSRLKTELPHSIKAMAAGLIKAQAKLVEFDLSDNAIGPVGLPGMKDLLLSPVCQNLTELRLHNTGMGPDGATQLATFLDTAHTESAGSLRLKVFVCGRSRLENRGWTALSAILSKMASLEYLRIDQDGISSAAFPTIAKCLASNPNLKYVNVTDNTATPEGCEAMAKALPKLKFLEELHVGDCLTETPGCLYLLDALEPCDVCPALTTLILQGNEIGVEAIPRLIDLVASRPELAFVDLNHNDFGVDGVRALKEACGALNRAAVLGDLVCSDDEDSSGESGNESDDETSDSRPEPFIPVELRPRSELADQLPAHSSATFAMVQFLLTPSLSTWNAVSCTRTTDLVESAISLGHPIELLFHVLVAATTQASDDVTKLADSLFTHLVSSSEMTEQASSQPFVHSITSFLGISAAHLVHDRKIEMIIRSVDPTRVHPSKPLPCVRDHLPPSSAVLNLCFHILTQSYVPQSARRIMAFCVKGSTHIPLSKDNTNKLIRLCGGDSSSAV